MQISYCQIFSRTIVNYGVGTRTLLPQILKGLACRRVVLFADKEAGSLGVINQIKELFEKKQEVVKIVGVIEDIEKEATVETVNRCAHFFKEHKGDTILALGGAGVLDTAKAVKWMIHKGISDISKVVTITERWPEADLISIPHIAIPILSGTGAEITEVTMITNEKFEKATSIYNPYINADVAILDPELTLGVSPSVTALTGFTTLVNAIEAFFSPRATPMSDAYAQQAIRLIANNLTKAVHEGNNVEAKGNLQLASYMAKSAFMPVISAFPMHNMALAFSRRFRVTQMQANAILLPNVLESLTPFYLSKIKEFSKALGIMNPPKHDKECLSQAVAVIRNLREEIALPKTLDVGFEGNLDNMDDFISMVHKEPLAVHYKIPGDVVAKIIYQIFNLPIKID
ncbi:iron-containing alcohol dehydrogenase [Bacillus sp. JJ722]|uniref:iron-containing alcohol dehydrogenase n=1 Tax=Bacillus sp. JJ722 TaxID=3122973 RepID=UPI0030002853